MKDEQDKLTNKKLPQNNIMTSIDSFFSSSPIKGMLQQMDNFFGHTFSEASLPVETRETSGEFMVICKLPGIKKEQITIETFDRYLTIGVKNEEQLETIDESSSYISNSYTMKHQKRTIPVPPYVKLNALQANYRDGLLQIRIPKKNIKQIKIDD
ncbi:Hsp20/alpha crystallin family protein [Sutcliffiella horikoshii]|uniref:Hsp20/alpha crystallin family protein n=1 Tax=Sutcliffiella horikoshii TaxID=79883 RepID=A0A5D4TIK7_9BACI|nr:Hsp20/alpha crystallin family protein [Sutcliffiella horikoshii]TYS74648.1 Hsp20/alpha crystallin family protein [Sutcliffiella horikoshii]